MTFCKWKQKKAATITTKPHTQTEPFTRRMGVEVWGLHEAKPS